MKQRLCQACGKDCKGKKVGATYFSKVICISCNASGFAGFNKDGQVIIRPENDWRNKNAVS